MATGGKRQESLERRESEIIRGGRDPKHKKRNGGNLSNWELESKIKELDERGEALREIQMLHGAGTRSTPLIVSAVMISGQIDEVERLLAMNKNELDELEGELENPIQHSPLEKHTRGSGGYRSKNAPDTVAVEQGDPEVMPTNAFTRTPLNQQTQKTSRPGIETFSQTTREVGTHDKELTDPQTYPWKHPTLSPTTRWKHREQGTSDSRERWLLEQDRGPSEQTMPEIIIERNLQLTFTQNGPLPERAQHR